MSKKKNSRVGWIEFSGLRFALKFTNRKDLINIIRDFFSRRGLKFDDLKIGFKRTTNAFDNYRNGEKNAGLFDNRTITVYVKTASTKGYFFQILFHELDHCAWMLEGKAFNHSLPFSERPHEIRAIKVAQHEVKRLFGSL